MSEETAGASPLGSKKVTRLMLQFAIPSIVAMTISSIYNLVDQLFIGRAVGTLGNAATNVAFPFTTVSIALALLFGIGGASNFNLAMGRGKMEKAARYLGNALASLFLCGVILLVFTEAFAAPLLRAFGATESVLPYALTYVRITAIGFPFTITALGGGHLMRADGSPKMTMTCNCVGALINICLDALFVMVFGWGMAGAAAATVIGQVVSACIVFGYMRHSKTVRLVRSDLRLSPVIVKEVASLGTANFCNQLAMMVVQIVMNNSLTYYGALSEYGAEIPLASCGIIMKVYQIFFSVVIGLAQGAQPIESFNYGARQYSRVRQTYRTALIFGGAICIFSFVIFRLFPRQILELFGSNTEEYFEFGVLFFKYFMFFTWLNFLQPITANFFTAIGKPKKGIFLSLTRQLIYILPLVLILPRFFGIMGILYAAPTADLLAAITTSIMAAGEFRLMKKEEVQMART